MIWDISNGSFLTSDVRINKKRCRRPGSNRHGYYYPRDFKSRASANSATAAYVTIFDRDKATFAECKRSKCWL